MKPYQTVLAVAASVAAVAGITLFALASATESDIRGHRAAVVNAAARTTLPVTAAPDLSALPAPVRRYFAFVFPGPVPRLSHVDIDMQGQFRRPKMQSFAPTQALSLIHISEPTRPY